MLESHAAASEAVYHPIRQVDIVEAVRPVAEAQSFMRAGATFVVSGAKRPDKQVRSCFQLPKATAARVALEDTTPCIFKFNAW
jgi:hypothetical protein